ncbi:MAG: hypothetical protein CMA72_07220 [Euryarchaeota archaeon]|nr:hypothetical protein [Euryarchaeota archaeon]|tara:strand:+ start:3650 stop:3925 length:276 start_codon:yes stop_codon:yes gene_type:complete
MATREMMNDDLPEETVETILSRLTPLERATYDATMSAIMLSTYANLQEVVEQIDEVEILRNDSDLEERALLPLAEAGLIELISSLPIAGEA